MSTCRTVSWASSAEAAMSRSRMDGAQCWPRSASAAWISTARPSNGRSHVLHGHRPQRRAGERATKVRGAACGVADFEPGDGADPHDEAALDAFSPLLGVGASRTRADLSMSQAVIVRRGSSRRGCPSRRRCPRSGRAVANRLPAPRPQPRTRNERHCCSTAVNCRQAGIPARFRPSERPGGGVSAVGNWNAAVVRPTADTAHEGWT